MRGLGFGFGIPSLSQMLAPASWIAAGRIIATITVAAADLATLPATLVTHTGGAGSAQISVNASKQLVVSCAGNSWTCPVALGWDTGQTLEIYVSAGGGSVASVAKAHVLGSAAQPWDLAGVAVSAPIQPAVAADASPTLGTGVSLSLPPPSWLSTWLPTDAGNVLWGDWRSDLGIAVATGVSGWTDVSGNNRVYAQASGPSQPAYVASSASFKSMPALDFDGSNDILACSSNVSAGPVSFAAVVRMRAAGSYPIIWSNFDLQNELRLNSTTGRPEWLGTSGTSVAWASSIVNSTVVITGGHNSSASFINVNGAGRVTGPAGTASLTPGQSNLGGRAAALFANALVSRLIVFNTYMDATLEGKIVSSMMGLYV